MTKETNKSNTTPGSYKQQYIFAAALLATDRDPVMTDSYDYAEFQAHYERIASEVESKQADREDIKFKEAAELLKTKYFFKAAFLNLPPLRGRKG